MERDNVMIGVQFVEIFGDVLPVPRVSAKAE
jgi:hypothetical protein